MKYRIGCLVGLVFAMASAGHAQVTVDVAKITCGQFLAFSIADPKEISTNGGLPAMPQIGNLTEFRVIGSNGLSALELFQFQLAALRFTPLRSATVESFLSAAFSSLRLVVRRRTTLSLPSSSAQAISVP